MAVTIRPEAPIGRLAAEYPTTTRVFERHRLDYCCSGRRPLADACASRNVDVDAVIREIEEEIARDADRSSTDWTEATPAEIIAHIVAAYHEPLRRELPRLVSMASKVATVHGSGHPSLEALSETVSTLSEDLHRHMSEEEDDVFPALVNGAGNGEAIGALEHDHDEAGAALEEIRRLTDDYALPPDACGTWRVLWSGLEELERTMHRHVHLENNVLFPRAATA